MTAPVISRQGSSSVGCLLRQIFPARELKAAFAAIAADNLLDGDVLVGLDLAPDGDGNGLAEVFQRLLLPRRIVPEIERLLRRRRHEHDQRLVAPACTQPPVRWHGPFQAVLDLGLKRPIHRERGNVHGQQDHRQQV